MSDDVTYGNTKPASWIPENTVIETKQQAGGEHRQVVAAILYDDNGNLSVDPLSSGIVTVEFEHHEIHEGDHYFIQDVVDLSINNVFDMQFTTPNSAEWVHFTFELDCEAETEWYIYEGVTINTAGTAATPINNNRNSSNTSSSTVATIQNADTTDANADTAVAGATALAHGIVGALRTGGNTKRANEIILKANTDYSFRAIATQAGFIGFVAEWYEHTSNG